METVNQDVKQESTPVAEVKEQPVQQDVKQEVESVPYARFAEATKQRKQLEEKIAGYEKKQEEQRQKDMEKKGEYETLLTEYRSKLQKAEEKANAFDKYVEGRKEAILSTYSDEERDIIGELSLGKLEKYHEKNINNENSKIAVDNARGGSTNSPPPTDFHDLSQEDMSDPSKWQSYLQQFTRRK